MANIFQIKRRLAGHADGGDMSNVSLSVGELAFNEVSNVFYYNTSSNSKEAVAGSGKYTTLDTAQTVSGDKTFQGSVDLGSGAVASTATVTDSSSAVANTEFVHNVASVLDGGSF